MRNTIKLELTPGQVQMLCDLTHEAAARFSKGHVTAAALRAIDLWQILDQCLHAWETAIPESEEAA